jgi:diadenosine tetraphosphate (Ap4A) HIT family hydrolase
MPKNATDNFKLDERLTAGSLFIRDLSLCQLRLQDDNRWPWLILVPRRAHLRELTQLSHEDRQLFFDDLDVAESKVRHLARLMGRKPDKLNIANLGNIVEQLHVHLIARQSDDINWPGPVWGHEQIVPYTPEVVAWLIDDLR